MKTKRISKFLSFLLAATLLLGALPASAANVGERRVTLGADLTEDQINTVYGAFGIQRGDAEELIVTNADERQYLGGLVSESAIGTRAISCTYLEVLPAGESITVATHNITYCTAQMYISALATAGITDAKVIVAAPFDVSGTAALTGIYKAYEVITGEPLDETAKEVGSQELAVTAELAQEIGDADSVEIVNQLKMITDETRNMTDDELRAQIIEIASNYDVTLSDNQIDQLIQLTRAMEKLDPSELLKKVQAIQETLRQFAGMRDRFSGFTGTVQEIAHKIGEAFQSVWEFIVGIFQKSGV